MIMDKVDTKFCNSIFKKWLQQIMEFPIFKKFLKSHDVFLQNKTILEVGCGAGWGLQLLQKYYNPPEIYGFDILPDEVDLARQKNSTANIFIGDVLDTKLSSKKFDGIFVLEVLHHVPLWRDALKELNRILKDDGVLLMSEHCGQSKKRLKRIFGVNHPEDADFTWDEFDDGIINAGFNVDEKTVVFPGLGFFMCTKTPS